jgi:hypothetical protein
VTRCSRAENRTRLTGWSARLLFAVVLLTAWLPDSAAQATTPTVSAHLGAQFALRANGVAMDTVVVVRCTRSEALDIRVSIQQALPDRTLVATNGELPVAHCAPGVRDFRVILPVYGVSFRAGPAAAIVDVLCDSPPGCSAASERVVSVTRAADFDVLTATNFYDPGLRADLPPTATLTNGGRTVTMRLGITCPPGHSSQIPMQLVVSQRSSSTAVSYVLPDVVGSSFCGATYRTLTLVARSGTPVLHAGVAFATVTLVDFAAPTTPLYSSPTAVAGRQISMSAAR